MHSGLIRGRMTETDGSREADLEDELEKLRQKAAAQEESLNKYRVEAEKLISGSGGMQSDQSKANGMMKAWLRDAKKQSEELKALFEQSRAVAAESAAIAKRDYEKKLARLKQDLAACEGERAAACSKKDATEQALQKMNEQVASMCEQRDMARLELKEALEKHGWIILRLESEHREEVEKISAANKQYQELTREQSQKSAIQEKKTSVMFEHTLSEMKTMMERSRESREKERKTFSAMLESANQVAESHKRYSIVVRSKVIATYLRDNAPGSCSGDSPEDNLQINELHWLVAAEKFPELISPVTALLKQPKRAVEVV